MGGPARLVEPCVKWSFALNRSALLPHTIQRACQLATSAPNGPVFVSVPIEILMESMIAEPPAVAALPRPAEIAPAVIDEVAASAVRCQHPVIVTEEAGRDRGAVELPRRARRVARRAGARGLAAVLRQLPAHPSAVRRDRGRGHAGCADAGRRRLPGRRGGAVAPAVGGAARGDARTRPRRGPAALAAAVLGLSRRPDRGGRSRAVARAARGSRATDRSAPLASGEARAMGRAARARTRCPARGRGGCRPRARDHEPLGRARAQRGAARQRDPRQRDDHAPPRSAAPPRARPARAASTRRATVGSASVSAWR